VTDSQTSWRRLADDLRDQIRQGRLAAGDRLPSESLLMQRTGLSRTTIRRAVCQLRIDGLIEIRAPQGSFVLGPTGPVPLLPGESVTSLEASFLTRRDGSTATYAAGVVEYLPGGRIAAERAP
jgi:GntR family transcriptional repressor for pyruvate dehydrogenase complex